MERSTSAVNTVREKGWVPVSIREEREALERQTLSPFAFRSEASEGRLHPLAPCKIRTCFQRDVDRITHAKAFRRLVHKTQVFLQPEGDHYRTRMTHTLEVTRIARTISRALRLNEDLTEAIAMGHDLGHTPFGHAGERLLNKLVPGGFRHNEQSLRVVDKLENNGDGLNLSQEVRDGILCHTGAKQPSTLEGQVVRISDRIAYINHDIDDALRGGIIFPIEIPSEISETLGYDHSSRINRLVADVVETSRNQESILQSLEVAQATKLLRQFMFESVYCNPLAKGEEHKAQDMLRRLYEYYQDRPEELPEDFQFLSAEEGVTQAVCDYIAGMTDKYALEQYSKLFIPTPWWVK